MGCNFRRYELGDIWQITNKNFDLKESMIDLKTSWSLIDEKDNIIGCAGFRRLWHGVYEVWLHAKDYKSFEQNKIKTIKFIKKQMDKIGANRIQATCEQKEIKNRDLLEFLGMRLEGVLVKYGPHGENHCMYARTR